MKGRDRGRDSLDQIEAAIAELRAVEGRIRGVEDLLTSGEAQRLPPAPKSPDARDLDLRLMQTALAVGALARRMNMRLGAIERALEGRGSIGVADSTLARTQRRQRLRLSDSLRRRSTDRDELRLTKDPIQSRPN